MEVIMIIRNNQRCTVHGCGPIFVWHPLRYTFLWKPGTPPQPLLLKVHSNHHTHTHTHQFASLPVPLVHPPLPGNMPR